MGVFHISVNWWSFTEVCITASLQDSSRYSGRSQLCSSFDGLHSSTYCQVFQPLYESFDDCTKSTNHNEYKRHFHVPQFLNFPSNIEVFILLFIFFQFYFVVSRDSKVQNFASYLYFLLIIIRSSRLADIRWSVCMLKSNRNLYFSFYRTAAGLCMYNLFVWLNLNFLHNLPVDHFAHQVVSSLILFLF